MVKNYKVKLDGNEKYIEVKATTTSVTDPGSQFVFHLSATEYERARKLPNVYFYIVFEVKSEKPTIWRIPNPGNLGPDRLRVTPSAYYATVKMENHD